MFKQRPEDIERPPFDGRCSICSSEVTVRQRYTCENCKKDWETAEWHDPRIDLHNYQTPKHDVIIRKYPPRAS